MSKPPPLAVFDLDNTIIKNDCGEAFFHFLVEEGKLPASRIREYYEKVQKEGGIVAYPWVVSLMAGMKEEEIYSACQEAIRRELKKEIGKKELGGIQVAQGIRLSPQMKELMKRMKQAGFEIWIISASNRWVVETTIQQLELPVDHSVGMAVTVKDGILTNIPVKPEPVGQGKREVIEQKIGRPPNFVAGDSASDFPMMEMATEIALFIDHGNKECQRVALERGWVVQKGSLVD
ncbi:MAG: haloacid dehalogenase-like hydrolase [Deltaproteobacteria bacterium]|nr:haloacid dehalogenase-like hydrolase [Deltaproteobacteria bacterium]